MNKYQNREIYNDKASLSFQCFRRFKGRRQAKEKGPMLMETHVLARSKLFQNTVNNI